MALELLDELVGQVETNADIMFTRGLARKFILSLSPPSENYNDKVLEYISDLVAAAMLEPKNDEYVAVLASEKLEYSIELERQCNSIGEPLDGDSTFAESVARSWQHTLELSRSALSLPQLRAEYRTKALAALSHALLATHQLEECSNAVAKWIESCGDATPAQPQASNSLLVPSDTKTIAPLQDDSLADALDVKGRLAEAQGNLESALQIWNSSLLKHPSHISTLMRQATVLRNLGRSEEAIKVREKLIELNPENPDFYYTFAADYTMCGRKEEAIEALKKALQIDPKHLFALNDLAFHYISDSDWQNAFPLLQEVLSQGLGEDIPWINMANVLYHMNDYPQALRSINNAFSTKRVGNRPPSAEEWLIKIAILRALSAQLKESIELQTSDTPNTETSQHSEATSSQPNFDQLRNPDYQSDIVKCFVNALKAVDTMELAQAYFEYADYLVEMGQIDQARAKMIQSLKLKPSATIEQLNLTRLSLQEGTKSLFEELKSR